MKCILLPARLQYFGSIGVLILKVIHTRPAKAGTESCRCAGVFHLYMHESGLSYINIINEQNLTTILYILLYYTTLYKTLLLAQFLSVHVELATLGLGLFDDGPIFFLFSVSSSGHSYLFHFLC